MTLVALLFSDGKTIMQKQNALIGALVADAAALGMHWLYDHVRTELLKPAR